MSDAFNYIVTDYELNVLGSTCIVTHGPTLLIDAGGLESNLILKASNAAGVFAGPATLSLVNEDAAQGQVQIGAGEAGTIKIACGPPLVGAIISMNAEGITLSVGPPGVGASISMTPESITFKVAEVSFSLTPLGITESVAEVSRETTLQGHNFTAAETEFNVGVQGITEEGPTKMDEVEGGKVENETLGTDTTDGVKNDDAGIIMTE